VSKYNEVMETVYEAAGGRDGLLRLAGAWHARVLEDEVVSHAFSHGYHAQHTERLAAYWAEALGGPMTYSEQYGDETFVVRIHSTLALSLELPPVLFSDDLDAIGRHVETPSTGTLRGVPVSAGVAEETALVLRTPDCIVPSKPYILVCPSTDPAWLPLFANARGLVMETGGILSHGAILAREFGLPAVTGLPGACQSLQTGQILRVDGSSGTVSVLAPRRRL
jgi:phosphohistidine swiveling domain-containing protein